MSVKLAIAGVAGRMGRRVAALAIADPEVEVVGGTVRPGSGLIGADIGSLAGAEDLGVLCVADIAEAIQGANVLVDFTSPQSLIEHIDAAKAANCSVVTGTTGLTSDEQAIVTGASSQIGIVQASNMSRGINALLPILESLAAQLTDYDIEIVETHHNQKRDAPSGTALSLGKALAHGRGVKLADNKVTGRDGVIGTRDTSEIGIMSLRAGDVVGDHTVILAGQGERIEITHRAHSRDTFAAGAVSAAKWLVKQPDGLFSMSDVLG